MASLQQAEVRNQLENKFDFAAHEGANHHRYKVLIDGKLFTTIDVSRNKKDIGQPLLGRMAAQAKVSSATFVGMISCTVSKDQYLAEVTPKFKAELGDVTATDQIEPNMKPVHKKRRKQTGRNS